MKRMLTFYRWAVGAAVLVALGNPSYADTLADTLVKAYQLSPALEAARAQQRATDEGVAQARAGKRPQVDISSTLRTGRAERSDFVGRLNDSLSRSRSLNVELTASLNLYDGGRTRAAINAAKAQVSAGRAQLKNSEQNLFLNAVAAYVDVRRDSRFVALGQNNVSVLRQQVRAARDRFELGEVTRTDVSLAEARLAQAQATLASFVGQLAVSKESFKAVVGVEPVNLQPPPPLPNLPATLDQAIAIAMRENPSMISARFQELVARYNLERADANRKSTLTAGANVGVETSDADVGPDSDGGLGSTNLNIFNDENSTLSYGLSLTASRQLYSGGALKSAVRQATNTLAQQKFLLQDTARQVQQNVASAWAGLEIAQASIRANREQVAAAQITFDGVREEARLGARTTLDVLDREQELRDAQVQLASSIRDEYVRAYELLATMGLLTIEHLNLGIEAYDPDVYYKAVERGPAITPRGAKLDKLLQKYGR